MKPTPFNPATDLAPLPFGERHRQTALRLKEAGLAWTPHVGCFVWDPEGLIPAASPFPDRVYFILNLGHFVRLLGTVERVRERLVWLPTWHQTRLVAEGLGLGEEALRGIWAGGQTPGPGEELLILYERILETLERR
ncbi:MAG TPA: hypothetical protein PLQ15_09890 [Syntrophales bacterium]|nr:hypothetical protein [Syntrophobacterales bacterium]HQL90901.1 hypothetical protein [Syntrophales bacterium]